MRRRHRYSQRRQDLDDGAACAGNCRGDRRGANGRSGDVEGAGGDAASGLGGAEGDAGNLGDRNSWFGV